MGRKLSETDAAADWVSCKKNATEKQEIAA